MADGEAQLNTGGEALLGDDGATIVGPDDCCCKALYKLTPCLEEGYGCEHCTMTPKYLTVTLAGVDASACDCITRVPSGSSLGTIVVNIDGQHVVQQVGVGADACKWVKLEAGTWSANEWDEDACAGSDTARSGDLGLLVVKTAAGYTVDVSDLVPVGGNYYLRAFNETTVAPADCEDVAGIPNDQSCDYTLTHAYVADGGTASIVMGDVSGASRCPGGDAYYTDTDLAAYVDPSRIVTISEDPGICYTVSVNADEELADGDATVTACWTTCAKCCVPDAEDCP